MMSKIALFSNLLILLFSSHTFAAAKPIPAPPSLEADSFYLVDFKSGRVLAEKDPDKIVEPASITKLMTAYLVDKALAAGDIKHNDLVTISETAWRMGGSKMFVEIGKQVPVDDLMKGLVIQSGNDASVALAEHIAGSEAAFVGYMNQQAQVLGMTNTQFQNATGWPAEGHYSTARDIAILTAAIIREYPNTYKLYREKEYTYKDIRQFNRNRLLWRDNTVDGVKTGHTEAAGYCLVASALQGDMRLISVVLGASSDNARTNSSQSLLNYGFRFFETHRLYKANAALKTARLWYGEQEQVALGVGRDIHITIPRGRYKELVASMEIEGKISAPITKGQKLGQVKISLDNEVIVTETIVATQAVAKGGFVSRTLDSIKLMFN
ncbi:D-alanyl-D-alanine carboxypeptidase DacC [Candidatus Nitrotoga sp. BS]|uniref:D-alanyl-D-alanine carboxypeptidase family protein n=1 Tax=Candidatus Nitrotoga sp. BS TaxID=2890408 RepID=UPI001EF1789E|nr:D-alanyl-D-alanine carboxypeptidase family protein [Candidatus Nitrotoga sp. BS]CAH1198142.1 D-alanyl-D-alanine carboxypeptidase DacC [Candidatus Nitrotoga sp. BS]